MRSILPSEGGPNFENTHDMELTAQTIANHVGGIVVGNPQEKVRSVAKIEQGKPGNICFYANPKYENYLYTCRASVILLNKDYELREPISATLIRVDNAYEAVASLLGLLNAMKSSQRRGWRFRRNSVSWFARIGKGCYIGEYAWVGRKARVGKNTQIHPSCYVGDRVQIGENCILYPGVKIYADCKIGNNVIIHANAVIGSDGFGFAPTEDGTYKKIPQTGIVVIGDDCEIGANTVVDRATMGETVVESGVKLDNLIQIAHNVVIGSNTVIAAQSGIAGSTKIGKNCIFGGQVGVAGHLTVADRTSLGAKTGVIGNVRKPDTALMGSPALDLHNYMRSYAIFKNLGKNQ